MAPSSEAWPLLIASLSPPVSSPPLPILLIAAPSALRGTCCCTPFLLGAPVTLRPSARKWSQARGLQPSALTVS